MNLIIESFNAKEAAVDIGLSEELDGLTKIIEGQ